MRILTWLLRAIVFVILFGLAVKNSSTVDVQLYLDAVWQTPLSLVILASFAAGTLIGMTALTTTLIRQRRELGRLRKQSDKDSAGNSRVSAKSQAGEAA